MTKQKTKEENLRISLIRHTAVDVDKTIAVFSLNLAEHKENVLVSTHYAAARFGVLDVCASQYRLLGDLSDLDFRTLHYSIVEEKLDEAKQWVKDAISYTAAEMVILAERLKSDCRNLTA